VNQVMVMRTPTHPCCQGCASPYLLSTVGPHVTSSACTSAPTPSCQKPGGPRGGRGCPQCRGQGLQGGQALKCEALCCSHVAMARRGEGTQPHRCDAAPQICAAGEVASSQSTSFRCGRGGTIFTTLVVHGAVIPSPGWHIACMIHWLLSDRFVVFEPPGKSISSQPHPPSPPCWCCSTRHACASTTSASSS
jgi:hypothetical protein